MTASDAGDEKAPKPPASFRRGAREVWRRLRGGELTPGRIAWSVAVGIAIGVTPLWGVHWLLVLAVCVPLRLDARVAFLASNVSLPFIAPFLSLAEIEIGAWARTGHTFPLDVDTLKTRGPRAFAEDLALGVAIFAPGAAALGGALAYAITFLVKRRGLPVPTPAPPSSP